MISSLATYRYVSRIDDGPRAKYKALVLHTAVSNATDLYDYWQSGDAGPGVGAHFYVNKAGKLYQYLDTDRYTGHAWDADKWSIGLESWDGGNGDAPWNPAQVATIVALARELGIPGKLLVETPSDGIGWHRQFPQWNQENHSCPGDAKVAQVPSILEAIDMAAIDDVAAACGMQTAEFIEAVRGGRALAMKGLKEAGPPGQATAAEAFNYLSSLEGGGVINGLKRGDSVVLT